MKTIIGIVTVLFCTLGGYAFMGGKLGVLWQPYEVMIIVGSAIGAYIISNTGHVLKATGPAVGTLFKGGNHSKENYVELLCMMFTVFKLARTKGWLALEQHIENPEESDLFAQFPNCQKDHHAITFFCDYLRIISLGTENPHELEALMDEELEGMLHEKDHVPHAVQTMADGMPALGIVAAVMGVIKTMGSISEPPEVLGKLIGGALVGTFLGVWVSYGFLAPMATALGGKVQEDMKYYHVIKISMLAFLQGAAPQVAIEFGRKILPHDYQPTFLELEEATNELPAPK